MWFIIVCVGLLFLLGGLLFDVPGGSTAPTMRMTRQQVRKAARLAVKFAKQQEGAGPAAPKDRGVRKSADGRPDPEASDVTETRRALDQARTEYSVLKCVRGMALGRWEGADNERQIMKAFNKSVNLDDGYTGTGGEFYVPEQVVARIIPKLTNRSTILSLNPSKIEVTEGTTITIPRETKVRTGQWFGKGVSLTPGSYDPAGALRLELRNVGDIVKVGQDLIEDAGINMEDWVSNRLATSLGLAFDLAGSLGDGGVEPRGLYRDSLITKTDLAGVALTHSSGKKAVTRVKLANGWMSRDNGAWLQSPETWGYIEEQTDTTGQPLRQGLYIKTEEFTGGLIDRPMFTGVPVIESNQIPKAADGNYPDSGETFAVLCGDWNYGFLVIRKGGIHFQVLREKYAEEHQVGIKAWLRADCGALEPGLFQIVHGITTTDPS